MKGIRVILWAVALSATGVLCVPAVPAAGGDAEGTVEHPEAGGVEHPEGGAAEQASGESSEAAAEEAVEGAVEKTAAELYAERQKRLAAEATERYEQIVSAYMDSRFREFDEALRGSGKYFRVWSPEKRGNVAYMRKTAKEFRPRWWDRCKAVEENSFRARIWNRNLTANYVPSEFPGAQIPIGVRGRKLLIIVTWRPTLVDNPRPLKGTLAERHGLKKGDLGEFIVWHELGHNYISEFLPLRTVYLLYRDHYILFEHLQEIYADCTGLYHASPQGRLSGMLFRLAALDRDDQIEAHSRAAFVVGSLLLSHMLSEIEDYPSVHLPPEVPDYMVERRTVEYVYENIDPDWSLAEDRKLRDFVHDFIYKQGESMLRRKGTLTLPSRIDLKVMEPEDRELQRRRDRWVAEQLRAAIDAGRADKPKEKPDEDNGDHEQEKPRIEMPW
jgi:hypothetical protein